jgi:DNA-binding transcriptional MocR family regulator
MTPAPTDTISFARGAPGADILPVEAVREAAARALESDWQRALSYGTGRGHPGLCEWIAEHHSVEPDRVMVTNGSMEAAALLFRHLLGEGDRVLVEQPTYDRSLLLLRRQGVELATAPLEADGVEVAAVEAACGQGPLRLAHLIPNFHNPAGCRLSSGKKARLVELADEHRFTIYEDDPYRLVAIEGEPGATMLDLDQAGSVIHAGSFSKTVSPGVRVGYLVGPPEEIASLARAANETYISPGMLAESIVWELCRSGVLERNVKVVTAALRERRDALVSTLREEIPEAKFVTPEGGYFLWLDLDDDIDTGQLLEEAGEEGVSYVAGADFLLEGGGSSLRLAFCAEPPDRIVEGVGRLARALERLRARAPA